MTSAPEAFEKWWQSVKLGGFMNDQIMPDHVRQAFDLGVTFDEPAPIWETKLPFAIERGDGTLIAKAMREYRPETSEEESVVRFFIKEFEKLDKPSK